MIQTVVEKIRIYLVNLFDALLGKGVEYVLSRKEIQDIVAQLEQFIIEIANGKTGARPLAGCPTVSSRSTERNMPFCPSLT